MFANYFELFSGIVQFYTTSYPQGSNGDEQLESTLKLSSQSNNETVKQSLVDLQQQQQSTSIVALTGDSRFGTLQTVDLLIISVVFVNLLLAKRWLVRTLHNSTYLKKLGLRQRDCDRLDECTWRIAYYTFTSIMLLYSCFIKHRTQDFLKSEPTMEYALTFDLDEYIIIMIETGFYLHATYALLFEDVWRRDSFMMLIHHVMAVIALVNMYTSKTVSLGMAIIVLRDTVDVLVELAKVGMCFRIQHGKVIESLERPIKLTFTLFTIGFTVNQLYYYPLYCLYHLLNIVQLHKLQSVGLTSYVTCAIGFLVLDLMWFLLIINLLYKMLFSSAPLPDLREFDDADELPATTNSTGSDRKQYGVKLNGKIKST